MSDEPRETLTAEQSVIISKAFKDLSLEDRDIRLISVYLERGLAYAAAQFGVTPRMAEGVISAAIGMLTEFGIDEHTLTEYFKLQEAGEAFVQTPTVRCPFCTREVQSDFLRCPADGTQLRKYLN